jgi:hypothetical protein
VKSYWERDQIKYSETEIRWAVNEVVGSARAFWIWPFHNVRFWFQERLINKLEGLKPTAAPAATGQKEGT